MSSNFHWKQEMIGNVSQRPGRDVASLTAATLSCWRDVADSAQYTYKQLPTYSQPLIWWSTLEDVSVSRREPHQHRQTIRASAHASRSARNYFYYLKSLSFTVALSGQLHRLLTSRFISTWSTALSSFLHVRSHQEDRHTDRQIDRQTDRQTDRRTDKHLCKQTRTTYGRRPRWLCMSLVHRRCRHDTSRHRCPIVDSFSERGYRLQYARRMWHCDGPSSLVRPSPLTILLPVVDHRGRPLWTCTNLPRRRRTAGSARRTWAPDRRRPPHPRMSGPSRSVMTSSQRNRGWVER